MPISGDTSSCTIEVVELHWMKESDLAMHTSAGIAVPALCGAWLDPDPPTGNATGAGGVRYVSCVQCDLIADLTTPTRTG